MNNLTAIDTHAAATVAAERAAKADQHTPGPWRWVGTNSRPRLFAYLQNSDFDQVGVALDGFTDNPSNARLIAAAPDLLAALEKIAGGHVPPGFCAGIENESRGHFQERMSVWAQDTARTAIASATGEEGR